MGQNHTWDFLSIQDLFWPTLTQNTRNPGGFLHPAFSSPSPPILHILLQLPGLDATFPATPLIHHLLLPDWGLPHLNSPIWFSSWLSKYPFKHTNLVRPHSFMASYAYDKNWNAEHGWQGPMGTGLCLSLTHHATLIMMASTNSFIMPSRTPKHLVNSCSSFRPQLKPTWSGIPLTSRSSEFLSPCIFLHLYSFLIFWLTVLSSGLNFRSHFSLALRLLSDHCQELFFPTRAIVRTQVSFASFKEYYHWDGG